MQTLRCHISNKFDSAYDLHYLCLAAQYKIFDMSITRLLRPLFLRRVKASGRYGSDGDKLQQYQLHSLISKAKFTEFGVSNRFKDITSYYEYRDMVPLHYYENLKPYVMRMLKGEGNILWPGIIKNYAQSSGTSDGKSKYIPISKESFKSCHYQGGFDVVAHYLNLNPESKIFDGKSFILGGSFANELGEHPGVRVGDLSANLIHNINPLANLVRVPSKNIALMEDWEKKLPALVEASRKQDITNISGVPSWFLTVLKDIIKKENAESIHDIWPNLEVFFHGGISFAPYREQYMSICDNDKMHYLETYNASEGFFAVQSSWDTNAMLLLLDVGVFYEFIPLPELDKQFPRALPLWEISEGETYALVITANNGLWRYIIGDTVKIESVSPVKIRIAGRTKHYINAFGEELMVYNADNALAEACKVCNVSILNYTAAPVYAGDNSHGHHQWLIEFVKKPDDINIFADTLDKYLQKENSDYEAKRYKDIFLDPLSITVAKDGLFDIWLKSTGKLGGQRKIPRLSNDRDIMDKMLELNNL